MTTSDSSAASIAAPTEGPPASRPAAPAARYGPDAGQPVALSDLGDLGDLAGQGVVEVVHHAEDRFYELLADGTSVALLVYEKNLQQVGITHAVVREDRRGHGLGTTLIASALDDLVAAGTRVANYCDSVARFLDKFPDYRRRVRGESEPLTAGRRAGMTGAGDATDHT
ncbi:GNAT family N-acetyltransferase [Nocardioides sp. YIM 152315]|uniref:GNAT family N-acetyltransferase n=1 Tax=Nocardioides sp. YIM 152315 TaxID=3031760 RepID=UPI0023DBBBA5|nr:GNAT family N-acetyltransferase [Nocardioides sp. YIM 152315]MDF1606334.1 GNAT family N-acetyltransferase [Nocardioides sp. YIM 152315]